uniref:Uncharacterized protein n=1 Tax=Tanacetum cinerariifolium TaxID=118510 RepID=A0A699HDS9_TANCI|nr:hypothetical protein [Tanacetum cinerariifolium]
MEEYIRLEEEKARRNDLLKPNSHEALKYQAALLCEPTAYGQLFDDLDYLKDFENKFPAIVYNDALTPKSDFLTQPIVCPQLIDKCNETSLPKCDEEEQNILYFNDLFPFKIIYLDGLKSDEDNNDMALPPRDQRRQYFRFEGLGILRDIVYSLPELGGGYLRFKACWYTSLFWSFFSTFRFREAVFDLDIAGAL